jgi:hypothetical protein
MGGLPALAPANNKGGQAAHGTLPDNPATLI